MQIQLRNAVSTSKGPFEKARSQKIKRNTDSLRKININEYWHFPIHNLIFNKK